MLIVDDEKQIRDGISSGIRWEEYGVDAVATAVDGVQAWSAFCAEPFDIVVTDIRMPGMDGIELSRRILGKKPDTQIMVVSGFSEFEYVYAAMKAGVSTFELKPLHEHAVVEFVKVCVKKIETAHANRSLERVYTDAVQENVMRKLLSGDADARARQQEHLSELFGVPAGAEHHFAAIRLYDGMGDETVGRAEGNRVFFEALKEKLGELFCEESMIFWQASLTDAIVIIYFKRGRLTGHSAQRRFERAIEVLHGRTGCAAVIAARDRESELSVEYLRALLLLEHTLYAGKNCVLSDDGTARELQNLVHPFLDMQSLKQAVAQRSARPALAALDGGLDKICREGELDNASVRNFCFDYLNSLRVAILEADDCGGAVDNGSFLRLFHIPRLDTIQEYRDAMRGQCVRIFAELEELRGDTYCPAIRKALQFIHENYAEALTMEKVAAYVGKSPNYFSKMFNIELGISLPNYIARVRVEAAKELLGDRSNDDLVYEVAEKVGFCNYKYFAKVFRHVEGCSVSDYRSRHSR